MHSDKESGIVQGYLNLHGVRCLLKGRSSL